MVVICPNPDCRQENSDGSKFCIHCGKPIPPVTPGQPLSGAPNLPATSEPAKKEEDKIESYCCGISLFIGVTAAIFAFLNGKSGYEIGYNLAGLFFMTWIVILFLQGVRWIYRKITKTG
jgi:hypothetical protein